MGIFSPGFFSFLFKAFIVLIPISLILKILRNLYIDKTINAYITLPDEKGGKELFGYIEAIYLYGKYFFGVMPFGLLLILALFVLLFLYPEFVSGVPGIDMRQVVLLLGIALVYGYLLVAEDSYYKKKILKAIEKS